MSNERFRSFRTCLVHGTNKEKKNNGKSTATTINGSKDRQQPSWRPYKCSHSTHKSNEIDFYCWFLAFDIRCSVVKKRDEKIMISFTLFETKHNSHNISIDRVSFISLVFCRYNHQFDSFVRCGNEMNKNNTNLLINKNTYIQYICTNVFRLRVCSMEMGYTERP